MRIRMGWLREKYSWQREQHVLEMGEFFVFIRDQKTAVGWSRGWQWQEVGLEQEAVSSFPFVLNPSHWRVISRGKWREKGLMSPFCKWIKEDEAVAWHHYYRYPGERRCGPTPGWGCKTKPEGTFMASYPRHPIGHPVSLGPGQADQGRLWVLSAFPMAPFSSHLHSGLAEHQSHPRPSLTCEDLDLCS